jgi:hypothetical protein
LESELEEVPEAEPVEEVLEAVLAETEATDIPRAIPIARPVAPEPDSRQLRPRRPHWRRNYPSPKGMPARALAPGTFLLVMGILQCCEHVFFGLLLVVLVLVDGSTNTLAVWMIFGTFVFLALLKDYIMIRGAIALRKTRSRRWAYAGAIAGFIPDLGCMFWMITLGASIWSLIALNDPAVKQAFDWKRYASYGDETAGYTF